MHKLLLLITLFITNILAAQTSIQSGVILVEFKTANNNGVAINAETRISAFDADPSENQLSILIDPNRLKSDNVEFDEAIQKSELDEFNFIVPINPVQFEFKSNQNEIIETQADVEINGIHQVIPIILSITNKKTNDVNTYTVTGQGEIIIEDFDLNDVLPLLGENIKFVFSQNVLAKYR